MLAWSPPASAEPVIVTNTGILFDWVVHDLFQSQVITQALDVSAPATQPGGPAPGGIGYGRCLSVFQDGSLVDRVDSLIGIADVRIAQTHEAFAPVPFNVVLRVPALVPPGAEVGPAFQFTIQPPQRANLAYESPFIEPALVAQGGFEAYVHAPDLLLFAGLRGAIGVVLDLADGPHFGWVEVEARFQPDGRFDRYVPVRWGFETAPGVPILVPHVCPSDLNGDGNTDGADISFVLNAFGATGAGLPEDLNGDGAVNGGDLTVILNAFGACP
ncbi:MAG: hypothetical protein D6693_04870 [Planctomycetota bacterium]|nr:MAG: hypothetical protein D6693_04870 [Planctomycetota bacterium]